MKKLAILFLSLVLVLSAWIVPTAAETENSASATVGYSSERVEKVDTSTVKDILRYEEFPYETAYKITNPEGLVALSKAVDEFATFAGVTIYLANDIDMSGVTDFVPIGNETAVGINGSPICTFCGTFDGQGNMIENLVMTSDSAGYDPDNKNKFVVVGLFGTNSAFTVKNLIIGANCSFTYTGTSNEACVSAVAAKTRGKCTIENVWSMATVSGGNFTGALSGRASGNVTYSGCTNSGAVTSKQCAGGFVGYSDGGHTFLNCRNTGEITLDKSTVDLGCAAAGIIARHNGNALLTMENCINNGKIVSPAGNAGAIVGVLRYKYTIKNCINYGAYETNAETKGLFAHIYDTILDDEKIEENNLEKTGEDDASLTLETIVPDYTPAPDAPGLYDPAPEDNPSSGNEDNGQNNTQKPAESETNPPETSTTTADSGSTEEESGCASAIGGVTAMLLTFGIAITCVKKKKD